MVLVMFSVWVERHFCTMNREKGDLFKRAGEKERANSGMDQQSLRLHFLYQLWLVGKLLWYNIRYTFCGSRSYILKEKFFQEHDYKNVICNFFVFSGGCLRWQKPCWKGNYYSVRVSLIPSYWNGSEAKVDLDIQCRMCVWESKLPRMRRRA